MTKDKNIEQLYETILNLDSMNECRDFLDDLCTRKEIEQFAQRLKAAKLLKEGKTYEQVIAEGDISSATLSRVSKCIKYGKGYNQVIDKMKK